MIELLSVLGGWGWWGCKWDSEIITVIFVTCEKGKVKILLTLKTCKEISNIFYGVFFLNGKWINVIHMFEKGLSMGLWVMNVKLKGDGQQDG